MSVVRTAEQTDERSPPNEDAMGVAQSESSRSKGRHPPGFLMMDLAAALCKFAGIVLSFF